MEGRDQQIRRARGGRRAGGAVLCLLLLGGVLLPRAGLLRHEHEHALTGHVHVAPDGAAHPPRGHSHGHHGGPHEHHGRPHEQGGRDHHGHHHDESAFSHHDEFAETLTARPELAAPKAVALQPRLVRKAAAAREHAEETIEATRDGAHVHAYDRYERSLEPDVARPEVRRVAMAVEIAPDVAARPSRSIFSRARAPPSVDIRI